MRRAAATIIFFSVALAAQKPDPSALIRLTRELRTAIQNGSLVSASEIAARLDEGVQAQQQSQLTRGAGANVDETLSWLPPDTESLWVNQEPFVITGEVSARQLYLLPTQAYSLDRLMKLNEGAFYRNLTSQTVRLVLAATRGTRMPQSQMSIIPASMPKQDVIYFYFFSHPVKFPPPDEKVQGIPLWQAAANISAEGAPQSGVTRAQQIDANWLALVRPDLLILTNRKQLLIEVLDRISHRPSIRALPNSLPEWAQADRNASFWGLRHYTEQSRPKPGQPGCAVPHLPQPDCNATGVTVRFDGVAQHLEIRYLSEVPVEQNSALIRQLNNQFQVEPFQPGTLRLASDVAERGPMPMHFAMVMLGFGIYR